MTSIVQKFKEMWAPESEYYEDDYDEATEGDMTSTAKEKAGEEKVVNFRKSFKSKVILVKPEKFGEDIKNVVDEMSKRSTIVLNLEASPKADSRRIIDFLSGAAYSQNGMIKKIATDVFIVTPCDVELEGTEILNELESRGIYF